MTVPYGYFKASFSMPNISARSRSLLMATALAAGSLSACASLPARQTSAQPKPAESYAASQSFTAPAADWPASDWWRAYGDPQLDQLINEALRGSPDMAQAEARVRKAEADRAVARAATLPALSGHASVVEEKESYNNGYPPQFVPYLPHGYNDYELLSLNFDYDFDFWGKNRQALQAATSDAKAAEADAAQARLVLSTAVAGAYADLARLYAERDVAERSITQRQETSDLVSHRVADGLDTRAESEQAAAGPPAARADLAAIDEQIAQTRDQLAALMGEGPDRGLAIQAPPSPSLKAFGLPQNLALDLVGRRPDIVAARWRAEAAAKRIGVAKAQFYPDIDLSGDLGWQSLTLQKLFASGSGIGQIGPALSLPIFEGGKLRANLRGARADYDDAVASYDAALTEALREVADVTASERALGVRLDESRQALAAYEEAYRVARLRYEGGLSNYQSVLLAEDSVLQSRRTVVDLEARAFTLDIQLIKALGGGFAPA